MLAFQPIQVGTMQLDHRLVVPPHSGGGGRLLDSEQLFERHCGYWLERVKGGVQCGFCTPGIVMKAKAMLDKNPSPTRDEIAGWLKSVVWQKEARHHIGEPDFVPPPRSMSCIGG